MFPKKAPTLPAAKLNFQGRIVSEPKELTHLLGEEYGRVRLRNRPVHQFNTEGKEIRKVLTKLKLDTAERKGTEPFSMKDLNEILKGLKSNKARDPEGLERIIFKSTVIGSNLKNSILQLFNNIKKEIEIPMFMRKATVTTIPKKGSKLLLKN